MSRLKPAVMLLFAAAFACQGPFAAARQQRRRVLASDPDAEARLSGLYRIDPERSDRLYSVVAGASSKLPYAEQQKFFIDLTVRLTPPDQLAIERRGRRIRIASSRAPRITFEADGVAHSERAGDGRSVTTRAALDGERLMVSVTGGTDDRFNVTFTPLEDGRFLQVTRRITAPQLTEPVVIHSIYEKVSNAPGWGVYGEPQIASDERRALPTRTATAEPGAADEASDWSTALRAALIQWVEATNRRDINRQMDFYAPTLKAFYLTRNVPRAAVRAEKARVFGRAQVIDIRADSPEIILTDAGHTAVMRFRKNYVIEGGGQDRRGEVIQELRWQRTPDGWKITSERDVRVLR